MYTVIDSINNPKIKYVSKLISSSHFRKKEGAFVAEGYRLCTDAIRSQVGILFAIATNYALAKFRNLFDEIDERGICVYEVSDKIFESLAQTKTPQGVLIVFRKTFCDGYSFDKSMIFLENVQNPLNMGTILRTAEAFNMDNIAISNGSCDVYSPKVIRGSMGAVFRLNIFPVSDNIEFLHEAKNHGMLLCATVPRKDAVSICDFDFSSKCCVIAVGNEANGLSENTMSTCDIDLTINMKGRAESLNVAISTAIILWEMSK